jgi:hypothetical protein
MSIIAIHAKTGALEAYTCCGTNLDIQNFVAKHSFRFSGERVFLLLSGDGELDVTGRVTFLNEHEAEPIAVFGYSEATCKKHNDASNHIHSIFNFVNDQPSAKYVYMGDVFGQLITPPSTMFKKTHIDETRVEYTKISN